MKIWEFLDVSKHGEINGNYPLMMAIAMSGT